MKLNYVNWSPDYWTEYEKKIIFNFWIERYRKFNINMSISGNSLAGGFGLFITEIEALKYETNENPLSKNHPVTIEYKNRLNTLLNEQEKSQREDKFRIELIINIEKNSYNLWLNKFIYSINNFDTTYYIKQIKSKLTFLENIYKDSLAALMEYDRKYNHPISYPDRDLFKSQISVSEYKNWLQRNGREIYNNSDDDIILQKINNDNINYNVNFSNKTYIPNFILESKKERETQDLFNGIKRSIGGVVESISKKEDPINNIKMNINILNNDKKEESNIDINAYRKLLSAIDESLKDEEDSDQETGKQDPKPHWILTTKNIKNKKYKYKIFDKNKQLQLIRSEWKPFNKRPIEGDFWVITEQRIKIFKKNASNIWKNKITMNLKSTKNFISKFVINKKFLLKQKNENNIVSIKQKMKRSF